MTSYSLAQIEDAVLAALEEALNDKAPTLRTYQGGGLDDLRQQTWPLPAVLVEMGQSRGYQVTLGSADLSLEITVLVMVRDLRGEALARREAGGAYELLEAVRAALWGQDLGLEVEPFSLVREEARLNTPELTVYAAHYRTVMLHDFA
jgi:phage gp37-like protein